MASKAAGLVQSWEQWPIEGPYGHPWVGCGSQLETVSERGLARQGAAPEVLVCAICWSDEGWGHFPVKVNAMCPAQPCLVAAPIGHADAFGTCGHHGSTVNQHGVA